jgi:hypothetical protein
MKKSSDLSYFLFINVNYNETSDICSTFVPEAFLALFQLCLHKKKRKEKKIQNSKNLCPLF